MKVLVTGGAGFIGSHLARRLVGLGHEVRIVDNLATGRRENLAGVLENVELLEADVADPNICLEATRGVDVVFHQAALASVPLSLSDPARTHRANLDTTFQVLEACRGQGVRRVVNAGSCAVYGDSAELPKSERMLPKPQSLYAVDKHVGELYGRLYTELFGVEVVSLRYFNVFGPRQDPDSEYSAVIPKFISLMLRGKRPTIFGDGQTSRDFVYIDDVIDANLLAMAAPNAAGEVLNIGSGESVSLNQLVQKLNRLLGIDLAPIYLPERPGDIRQSQADIGLALNLLGYRPRVPLEDGLARTIQALDRCALDESGIG